MFKFRDKVIVTWGFYKYETWTIISIWETDREENEEIRYGIKLDLPLSYVECIEVEESLLESK